MNWPHDIPRETVDRCLAQYRDKSISLDDLFFLLGADTPTDYRKLEMLLGIQQPRSESRESLKRPRKRKANRLESTLWRNCA